MKKKVNRKQNSELDKFDRKQRKHSGTKSKNAKGKLSIYDSFEDEDLVNYSTENEGGDYH